MMGDQNETDSNQFKKWYDKVMYHLDNLNGKVETTNLTMGVLEREVLQQQ